jgi:hypothetical protein
MSDVPQPTVAEVRAAAEAVKAAIDRHLAAIENRTGEEDPEVFAAFDALALAAEAYDELLYDTYDEVTPFEVPAGDSLPAYGGPAEPGAITVFIRRDYTIADAQRLVAQADRVADDVTGVGSGVNAAIGVLFGEYEPDETTLWVAAAEPSDPGEWLPTPFDQADPELIICRFDVSSVYDDELEALDPDR